MDPNWLDLRTLQIDRADLEALVPFLPEGSALAKVHLALADARYDRIWINDVSPVERAALDKAMSNRQWRDRLVGWSG